MDMTYEEWRAEYEASKHWLDFMSKDKFWNDTQCGVKTQTFDSEKIFYGSEWFGDYDLLDELKIEYVESGGMDITRKFPEDDRTSEWFVEVQMFEYEGYLYTIMLESIYDAQTFTAFTAIRKPLIITKEGS